MATIRTLAKASGYSTATVSLALRDSPRVSPEVRQQIRELAESQGYVPNPVVSRLIAQVRASRSSPVTSALALVFTSRSRADSEKETVLRWWAGCASRAAQLGYHLDVFRLSDPGISPARLGQILEARGIDGVVITGPFQESGLPADLEPLWRNRAVVVVGEHPHKPVFSCVLNNQFLTSWLAMKALSQRGYQRPALCLHPDLDRTLEARFTGGYLAGLRFFQKPCPPLSFGFGHTRQSAFQKWIARSRPDVVLTLHHEVQAWLHQMGLATPRDIGLAHLDVEPDGPAASWAGIIQHNERVGLSSIDMLIGQLHRNEFGIPPFQKTLMVDGEWKDGTTARPLHESPENHSQQKQRPTIKTLPRSAEKPNSGQTPSRKNYALERTLQKKRAIKKL